MYDKTKRVVLHPIGGGKSLEAQHVNAYRDTASGEEKFSNIPANTKIKPNVCRIQNLERRLQLKHLSTTISLIYGT